jgi:hypothetical protein
MMRHVFSVFVVSVFVVLATASVAIAQSNRLMGYHSLRVDVGPVIGRVSLDGGLLQWKHLDPVSNQLAIYASATMPWTVAGSIVAVAPDKLIVSGYSPSSGVGYLSRVALSTVGAAGVITQIDSTSLPGIDPHQLYLSPVDLLLYVFDTVDRKIYGCPWAGWVPLAATGLLLDCAAVSPRPWDMRGGQEPGELATGAYLLTNKYDLIRGVHAKYHVQQQSGAWSISNVTETHDPIAEVGLSVRNRGSVAWDTGFEFRMTNGGLAELERLHDGVVVAATNGSATAGWQQFPLAAGVLDVGKAYRVRGLGYKVSDEFWPSFRAGYPSSIGGLVLRHGRFQQQRLVVGKSDFAVWGNIDWMPTQAPPGPVIPYFLAVRAAELNSNSITVLPNGQAVLAQFDAVMPGDFWTSAWNFPETLRLRVPLPIPDQPGLDGLPLLFQWGAFDPNGVLLVSDVFGGRVIASPSSASFAGGSGGGSGGASGGGQGAAAAWMQSCDHPPSNSRLKKAWKRMLRN